MEKAKNYSKPKYYLYILITVGVLVLLMGLIWLIMAFANPVSVGKFAYKMGWNGYAHTLYMRDYKKSNSINSLYTANNISIKLGNSSDVISEFEILSTHANYTQLIANINENNLNLHIDNFTKSSLINEDEYLKNHYVLALVRVNRLSDAFEYASDDFAGVTPSANKLGNYLFGNIVDNLNSNQLENFNAVIFEDIKAYFNHLEDILNNFDIDNEVNMFALCSKMMKVGENIIKIDTAKGDSADITHTQNALRKANDAMQTLLGE
ncbi:MAG: hypothetical protein J6X00_03620 [Clostridia bacterium]|nr:hypothetical protein [Clostridia bacterium]